MISNLNENAPILKKYQIFVLRKYYWFYRSICTWSTSIKIVRLEKIIFSPFHVVTLLKGSCWKCDSPRVKIGELSDSTYLQMYHILDKIFKRLIAYWCMMFVYDFNMHIWNVHRCQSIMTCYLRLATPFSWHHCSWGHSYTIVYFYVHVLVCHPITKVAVYPAL